MNHPCLKIASNSVGEKGKAKIRLLDDHIGRLMTDPVDAPYLSINTSVQFGPCSEE